MSHQLRYAIGGFVRRPAFAIALITSVALGIGGNSVVLGFMNGLLTRPMALPDAPGIAVTVLAQRVDGLGLLSPEDVSFVAQQTNLFATVIAVLETRHPVRVDDRSSIAAVAWASPAAGPFFGLRHSGGVVVSNTFAARELGGKRARDAQITIDDTTHAVAGVAPPSLEGAYIGRPIDIWILSDPASPPRVLTPMLSLIARLRAGASIREAQRELSRVSDGGTQFMVAEVASGLAPDMQGAMNRLRRLMPAVAGAVFLIACANVAVLLLSRASRQSRDTALRMAIGATRVTLAKATLIDAGLIAVAGAAAGVLVAVWTADVIPALLFAPDAERMTFVADRSAILLSAAISAFVVICCGATPIVANRHDTPARVLSREPDRPSRTLGAIRKALVISQMAVCCMLVIAAVTVSAALEASLRTAAGDRLESAIVATTASRHGYHRPDLGLQYFGSIEKTMLEEPGVSGVAWATALPGSRPTFQAMGIERPSLPTREMPATASVFTADSLPAVELPPLSGRMFGGTDTRDGCRVSVITTVAATRLFASAAPVGRLIGDSSGRVVEIVGVVSPKKNARGVPRAPDIYYYEAQEPFPFDGTELSLQVPALPPPETGMLDVRVVSASYFGMMGLERIDGRLFDGPDSHPCRVGVLNRQAADLYFGGNAVGGAVIDGRGRRITIVGVVRDERLRSTHRRPEAALYVPLEQEFAPKLDLLIASNDASAERQAQILRRLSSIDGGAPAALAVATLEDRLSRMALASERIAALLLSVASVNALALAVIGLYRITADDVLERQREMAVRSALGAQSWHLILLVIRRVGRTVLFGVLAGTIGAAVVLRWVGGVTGVDGPGLSWIWLAGPLAIACGSVIASLLPARRIMKLDPLAAMRSE